MVFANNSIIFLTSIGETNTSKSPPPNSNNGLQCITDKMPCCRPGYYDVYPYYTYLGGWFYANGTWTEVQRYDAYYDPTIYRNRGCNDGTVNLNRVNNTVVPPTGLYCCVVPDATDIERTLCANIGKLLHD